MSRAAAVVALLLGTGLAAAPEAKAGLFGLSSRCTSCSVECSAPGHWSFRSKFYHWSHPYPCPVCSPRRWSPCPDPCRYVYPNRAPRDFWMLR